MVELTWFSLSHLTAKYVFVSLNNHHLCSFNNWSFDNIAYLFFALQWWLMIDFVEDWVHIWPEGLHHYILVWICNCIPSFWEPGKGTYLCPCIPQQPGCRQWTGQEKGSLRHTHTSTHKHARTHRNPHLPYTSTHMHPHSLFFCLHQTAT